jgi:lipopolysaccharide transport system permease protein
VTDSSVLDLGPRPSKRLPWLKEIWAARGVIGILTRKDFQTRYKRASFGLLWAVLLPLIQAVVFVVIFSRIGRFTHTHFNYSAYVLAGTLSWAYFNSTCSSAVTSIVDGSGLTDKVWFPRSVLVIVPAISNLFGLATSMVLLIIAMPIVHAHVTWHLVLIVPAITLLCAFVMGFGLVASALHVYYRDVKFIVLAGLVVLFYLTPIVYPASALRSIGPWLDYNPLTGIIGLFQFASAGSYGPMLRALVVSVVGTVILLVAGLEANRHYDRLFVDKL